MCEEPLPLSLEDSFQDMVEALPLSLGDSFRDMAEGVRGFSPRASSSLDANTWSPDVAAAVSDSVASCTRKTSTTTRLFHSTCSTTAFFLCHSLSLLRQTEGRDGMQTSDRTRQKDSAASGPGPWACSPRGSVACFLSYACRRVPMFKGCALYPVRGC